MERGTFSRMRATLLAGSFLILAACATEPASYGYYGSSGYPAYYDYGYGAPVYGSLGYTFHGGRFYGGRRYVHRYPGLHRGGHFVHGGRPAFAHRGGRGFAHGPGGHHP